MGKTIWFTGFSGAGKTTLARALLVELETYPCRCVVLDGDELRLGLCSDLGYSEADRTENIRRVAHIASLLNAQGLWVLVALISPNQNDRQAAKTIVGHQHFLEVHVSTRLSVCESRDVKGLYAKARCGRLPGFTGIDAPYDIPVSPAISIDTSLEATSVSLSRLIAMLKPFT